MVQQTPTFNTTAGVDECNKCGGKVVKVQLNNATMHSTRWWRREGGINHFNDLDSYVAVAPSLHLGGGAPSVDGISGPPLQHLGIIGVVDK